MGNIPMINLSNSYLISLATKILIVFILTKSISLALLLTLPDSGVELNLKQNYKPNYHRIDFKNMVKDTKEVNMASQKFTSKIGNITNMLLKGIYGTEDMGFAIVAQKSSPKTTKIVEVGEMYLGYKLKSIMAVGVIFIRDSKEYILNFGKPRASKSFITKAKGSSNTGAIKNISRNDIKKYVKNPAKIWKQISIQPLKNGRKLKGFKVTRVLRGSEMAQLGLQKNDIIIKVNNIELNSFKKVTDFYANINKIKEVEIVVLRNNEEKELAYEIH
jgi:general secretion pathway protein C